MANLTPQYAFVAGEVSPEFFGRTDLVKYSLGVSTAINWFVGFRGGMYTRSGHEFVGEIKEDDKDVILHRFIATGDDYVLMFGHQYFRVLRNGGYLLETATTISGATAADPCVITDTGHGYTSGDWVYISGVGGMTELNGRYFEVTVLTANTYSLQTPDGVNLDASGYTAYTSGGSASRVYTLTTPYDASDLRDLRVEQELEDTVTVFKLTHTDYKPRKLTYTSDTSWSIAEVSFGSSAAAPTGVTLTPSSAGTAGVAFGVTAIVNGVETVLSDYGMTELSVDYTATAGSMKVTWTGVTDATEYYVYRSLMMPTGADITKGHELGYIGRALSTQFTDQNITPDFTKLAPVNYNPFADGTIQTINVTAAGSGYTKSSTVSVSGGGGSGFVGYPVVNAAGQLLSIVIVNGGSGYSSPTVTVSGGTGATIVATAGPTTGNNPAVYKKFQQRGVYAGTMNYPMTVWGSRVGQPSNFDVNVVIQANDSYEFPLDESSIQPIEHLVALRTGLLVFTAQTVTQLKAEQGRALTPLNALAEPQLYKGISSAQPLTVDLDVIFCQQFSNAVNAMMYTEYTESFEIQNISLLSDHLIGPNQQIVRLEYAEEPDKIIYALREDGVLLTLTYDRNEQVFGWARQQTQGLYQDIVTLQEGSIWKAYYVVERYIGGAWRKFIERQSDRDVTFVEDYIGVDASLSYPVSYPSATLTADAVTGTGITVTASASVFTSGNVGDIIYMSGGKLEITAYTSGTEVTCTARRDISEIIPEKEPVVALRAFAGEWALSTPTTEVTGLWHLEGETVDVLADGDVYLGETVADGKITIDNAASKVVVGLPYNCDLKTLPVISTQGIIEPRKKRILGMGVNLYKTRGLAIGPDFDNLVEMKDLTDEDWGETIKFREGTFYEDLEDTWSTDGTISLRQNYPLPAALLNLIADIEVGEP